MGSLCTLLNFGVTSNVWWRGFIQYTVSKGIILIWQNGACLPPSLWTMIFFFSIGDWEIFSTRAMERMLVIPLGYYQNRFRVPMYVPNNICSGHSWVTMDVHASIPSQMFVRRDRRRICLLWFGFSEGFIWSGWPLFWREGRTRYHFLHIIHTCRYSIPLLPNYPPYIGSFKNNDPFLALVSLDVFVILSVFTIDKQNGCTCQVFCLLIKIYKF